MAKCPVLVPKGTKNNGATRNCNCDVTGLDGSVFYKVEYSELSYYRSGEGKYEDIVGICSKHAQQFSQPKAWLGTNQDWRSRNQRTVNGLRGTVGRVSVVTESLPSQLEAMHKRDMLDRVAANCKHTIKRMMGQKNHEKLSLDDWEKLFDECLQEFTVERVMES